ncbi:hypothetical protein ncot_16795 [Nocardioides sp. JQ2195]|uniref:hypothetical protein n=1 Tax=Nocardioides sp. JQ2195 TaxID=2592334 RepID=UPI00143EA217|nr:hypothetical protein [Nocardioides sp. JQ2195]QIX28066.1 hypothetical protein ncot_16795 [Nocardioides sp. JQ2195]
MSIKLPRAAIAAALASTLLLAGCNGDGDSNDSGDGESTSQSQGAESDGGDDSATTDGATDGGSDDGDAELTELDSDSFYETVMTAQKDAGSFKGVTTTTTGQATMTLDLESEYTDNGVAAKATTRPDAPQQISTIVVDGVMYMQADGIGVPEGKWLKFDPSDPKNAGNPLSQLMDMSDPETFFGAMDDPKHFELIGQEDVDGVAANHYNITISSETYAENLDLPAEVVSMLPPELTFDMWIDAENRPVKVTQEYEIRGQTSQVEQTYSDYGVDVDIEAPADADTVTR